MLLINLYFRQYIRATKPGVIPIFTGHMVTTVYIIRHGETVNAEEMRYNGQLDVPLSPDGKRQVKQLARHLKNRMNPAKLPSGAADGFLDCIYCSNLTRAMKSAEIIAEPFGLKPLVVPALRERSFGRWEGMTFQEIREKHPEDFDGWTNDPLNFSPDGGESTADVRDRVMAAFHDIIEKQRGKKIAMVAHGGVNRIIVCELLGVPLENIFRIEQDFGALNLFNFYEEVPVIKLLNYTAYRP